METSPRVTFDKNRDKSVALSGVRRWFPLVPSPGRCKRNPGEVCQCVNRSGPSGDD